jgi:DnaJ-domain-containing protein 1
MPWIDTDSLKEDFLKISTIAHPDRIHAGTEAERDAATKKFAELNSAYNCLRDPKLRLLHLLELELGAPPPNAQEIPPRIVDVIMEAGQACREADAIVASKSNVSPLLQAQWFERAMEFSEKLGALQQRIHSRRDELLAELKTMNKAWSDASPPGTPERAASLPLRRLEEIGRELSYIGRWSGQVHEGIAQLSF